MNLRGGVVAVGVPSAAITVATVVGTVVILGTHPVRRDVRIVAAVVVGLVVVVVVVVVIVVVVVVVVVMV